jgi:hypothetical protein
VDENLQELIGRLRRMSPDQLKAWILAEPDPVPLHSFDLRSHQGRCEFLHEFYGVGPDLLFQAVTHVWNCLAEPKAIRCTLMGTAAGTGRLGKQALVRVLSKFIEQALAIDNPLPARSAYPDLKSWHEAAMSSFAADETELAALVQVFATILDGRYAKEDVDCHRGLQGHRIPEN